MKISRIRITTYKGIEALDAVVSPAGAVVAGDNAQGKSTILRAIRAALESQDISQDAIRIGADRAEILVDLDDLTVRRIITQKDSKVVVEKGGLVAPKPQTFLNNLLGSSALDPMDLLTKKAKERRDRILESMPVTVTIEQLRKWVPKLPDTFDCSGHGLAVIERLHTKAYEQRTTANAAAKAAKTEAERLAKEIAFLELPEETDTKSLQEKYDAARSAAEAMATKKKEAAAAIERTSAARGKIQSLRKEAAQVRNMIDPSLSSTEEQRREASLDVQASRKVVEKLEAELEKAKQALDHASTKYSNMLHQVDVDKRTVSEAESLESQADTLEQTLALASVEAPSAEELDKALAGKDALHVELQAALEAESRRKAGLALIEKAKASFDDVRAKDAEAARLDGVVRLLSHEAPNELLASCNGILGLTLRGDEVLFEGKSLDDLSGAEQVKVCVEIARRANAKSKIILVDGLEKIGPDHRETFLREATRDGFQVIATLVDRGALVIQAMEADDEEVAP